MIRLACFVVVCALAIAACTRIVDLTPRPDGPTDSTTAFPDGGTDASDLVDGSHLTDAGLPTG
jgi:hypothetical protein